MKIAEANRVTSFLCDSSIEMQKVIYSLVREDLTDGSADNWQFYNQLGHCVESTLNFAILVLHDVARDEVDELAAIAKDVSATIRATKQRIVDDMWELRTRAMSIDGVRWDDDASEALIFAPSREEDEASHLEAIRTGGGSLLKIVEDLNS